MGANYSLVVPFFPFVLPLKRKKELGQHPAISTKQAWLITHIFHLSTRNVDGIHGASFL